MGEIGIFIIVYATGMKTTGKKRWTDFGKFYVNGRTIVRKGKGRFSLIWKKRKFKERETITSRE